MQKDVDFFEEDFEDEDDNSSIVQKEEDYYYINIDENIEGPDQYREVYSILRNATEKETVVFNLNTFGGLVHTTIQLYLAIKECKAETIAKIYSAYSAGTIIALACDKIFPQKFCIFMIHNASQEFFGRENEFQSKAKFYSKWGSEFFKEVYGGFLTPKEIRNISSGSDLWLGQSDILKRLERREKYLNEQQQKNR